MRPFFFGEPSMRCWKPALLFVICLVLGWLAYHPGLHGYFVFDDFANLRALGANGPIDNSRALLAYLTSGKADPTGRPLALLSFLIDANDWPSPAFPFKYTSILLHLLNGSLLTLVLVELGRQRDTDRTRGEIVAVLAASFWTLHPLLVSTTLYVVQREAMLPATFILIGFLAWTTGRKRFLAGAALPSSLSMMILGAWGCTLLAVMSKANGILLPLLLAVGEVSLFRPLPPVKAVETYRRWRLLVLGLPIISLLVWLISAIPGAIIGASEFRSWTITQRLLTEPRILVDYLALLVAPRAISNGIFNDQIQASTSLLHPWTTLPCLSLVLAILWFAWISRHRYALASFALLFFFAGHLLESTFLPLELYFEHRNYVPAMFLFWPIADVLVREGPLPKLRLSLVLAIPLVLAALTHARAMIWGDPYRQAIIWAQINPDSPRAQANAAIFDIAHGRYQEAIFRARSELKKRPEEVQLAAQVVNASCAQGAVAPEDVRSLLFAIGHATSGSTVSYNWIDDAIRSLQERPCRGLNTEVIHAAIGAARANPHIASHIGPEQDMLHAEGELALIENRPQTALDRFNDALRLEPRPGLALQQAGLLGQFNHQELALSHLDYFSTLTPATKQGINMQHLHNLLLNRQNYWQTEEARLRTKLEADLAHEAERHE